MPGPANTFGHRMLVNAVDRLLTGGIKRRHNNTVGIAETGAEIAKEIAYARIPVRLKHGDQPAASTAARGCQYGAYFHRVMGIVVVNRSPVPRAGQLIAPLHAGEIRKALMDCLVANAGLARNGNCSERVERIVLSGKRDRPAADRPLPAAHTPTKFSVNQKVTSLIPQPFEHEVGTLRSAIRQKPAPIAAQLQPLDHVTHNRVIDTH